MDALGILLVEDRESWSVIISAGGGLRCTQCAGDIALAECATAASRKDEIRRLCVG